MSYAHYMTPTVAQVSRTDAGLASELRVSVMRLRRRLVAERASENELSLGQMAVLGALYRDGVATVGQLAERERVKPPSMTRTVNCLAEGGYVDRNADDDDKRLVLISITDKGREMLLADRRRRDAWLAVRITQLTPEERATLRAAAPILARFADGE